MSYGNVYLEMEGRRKKETGSDPYGRRKKTKEKIILRWKMQHRVLKRAERVKNLRQSPRVTKWEGLGVNNFSRWQEIK